MKTKEKKELHAKSKEELTNMLKTIEGEVLNLQLEHAQRKLKNTRLLFMKKKDIAIIKTVINGLEDTNESV